MVRQFLLMAGLAASTLAFADVHQRVTSSSAVEFQMRFDGKIRDIAVEKVQKLSDVNITKAQAKQKAPGATVMWKRPAGQYWGTGYVPNVGFYYFTPLAIRPWVEYTFENISSGVSGDPTWSVQVLKNPQSMEYNTETFNTQNASKSYLRYENCAAPRLSYKNQIAYPTQFDGEKESVAPYNEISIYANDNINAGEGNRMVVSSHYWGMQTRLPEKSPIGTVSGLAAYPGMAAESGQWFGTNNDGLNATATRFEKPDTPYLLNGVYWFYVSSGPIPANIPLKAYVYKTENPASEYSNGAEGIELGELIAVSESFVPASLTEVANGAAVKFEFKEKNPVTGAETNVSLEIEDDICIVVTGYDADLGNGEYITSVATTDTLNEGHGNLGFIGQFNVNEEGGVQYGLVTIETYLGGIGFENTVVGILADVSYPWIFPYFTSQEDDVLLPNEGVTTEEVQGLQYVLYLESTSMTEDMEVTFDGEENCDWIDISDVYDEIEVVEGEEYYTGLSGIEFDAAPNPEDVSRTCVVRISIPGAHYDLTLRQGSKNSAVEVVGVESSAEYYDLQGRRVANPDKGIYIKKAGNKATKVIL